MHPPQPPNTAPRLSWRARLASLRNIRPLLRMVWETSPPLLVAGAFLRVLRALLPLSMLWVSKLILDAVVGRISRGTGTLSGILKLVALELALALASDILGRTNTLCDSLLGDRFTNQQEGRPHIAHRRIAQRPRFGRPLDVDGGIVGVDACGNRGHLA